MKANTFLLGCPRSGTTLLTEILNCNDMAAILMERHSHRDCHKILTLNDYSLPAVSDFQSFPCEHGALNFAIIQKLCKNQDQIRLYGDKIPKLFENLAFLESAKECKPIKIIATLRNPFDVCMSYNARLQLPTDDWRYSIEDGIRDWNTFLTRISAISRNFETYIFDYDNASSSFQSSESFSRLAAGIYDTLGIDSALLPSTFEKLMQIQVVAKDSLPSCNEERLNRRLSPREMKLIASNANFKAFNELSRDDEVFYKISG